MKRIHSLFVPLLLLACMMVLPACSESKFVRAAKATTVAASAIKTGIEVKRAVALQGEISPAGELAITHAMREVNGALLQCADAAQDIQTFTPDAKISLLGQCTDVSAGITRLQEQGVLHLKNEKAHRRLSRTLTALRVSTEAVALSLQLMPTAQQSSATSEQPRPSLDGRGVLAVAVRTLRENDTRLEDDITRLSSPSN